MIENAKHFFLHPTSRKHILYEALRTSFVESCKDEIVCSLYEININTFRTLKRDFKKLLKENQDPSELFFIDTKVGKRKKQDQQLEKQIITLRIKNLSVPDIKAILASQGIEISLWQIDQILKDHNFPPLPRRTQQNKQKILVPDEFKAPEACTLELPLSEEKYPSLNGSIFLFYSILQKLNIEKIVEAAAYPETSKISRLSSILSFLALKLLNTKRLSHSNDYALDKGLGLFAKLPALPKDAWFCSYSNRVSREMNKRFLYSLNKNVEKLCASSGDFNLDFTTIPHWGDESILERNWSGTRRTGLKSVLALIVQDQGRRFLKYGNAEIKHDYQSDAILEFVDFYKSGGGNINCLIFDSKFTTYSNLNKLNKDNIKFLTLRRRSKKLIEEVEGIASENWQRIKLGKNYRRKHRNLLVYESNITLRDYEGELRQIIIKNTYRQEPAFIITNDFAITLKNVVIKYAKRWLVEQEIAEQIEFYHLNRLDSSIVVKVDFDLTMSILADTVYKLFSQEIPGYENCRSEKIYRNFIKNYAQFDIQSGEDKKIEITLNKKVNLPLLYETDWFSKENEITWLDNYKLVFKIGTSL